VYTLFKPLYIRLTKKNNWNRKAAALTIIVLSFFIILIPFFSVSWMLIGKIIQFRSNPTEINQVIEKIDNYVGVNFNQPDLIPNALNRLESWVAGTFPSAISRALHILLLVIVMYFMVFFMFIHHEYFENMLLKYVPFPEKNAFLLANEFKNITYAGVIGQGIIACSQGIFLGIGFLIFGIPDPVFWGIVAMLFAFIPLVGPAAVFIPAGLLFLSSGNSFAGIGIILYQLVLVGLIEYFLRFYIARKVGNIHPIIIVLGLLLGLPLFGILGLVIGPLMVSFFILLVGLYESDYVEKIAFRRNP
jgi:predicted PurR-regulated permease PerM